MLSQGNQGQTGKQVGQNLVVGLGEFTDQLITQLMARYYEQTVRGNVFGVVFAAAATAAPSATALPAFALWNPAGSGKNLVMLAIKAYLSTFTPGTTATAVGLVPVLNQQPTSVGAGNTPRCSLIGAPSTSVAATYVSGTMVAANTTASRIISAQYLDLAAGDVDDFLERLSKDSGGLEDPGEGDSDNDSEQESVDGAGDQGRSNKKQRIYEAQMPWFSTER